ncbi:putative WD repeat-containing protein C2A9.03 [Artemisia annua]|uniref:Putative WD repeat-containing protein C2A9.03 n=1 Tax=Artemisia annua TaxID=35608 RepID=A0A2U1LEG3_ARTAN|nr:putative WD repeat-containing protein C2A9.03 [Artemisia annua]
MKVADTSSAQARKGKDIQGIPWDRLNITRESYRCTKLEQYRLLLAYEEHCIQKLDQQ